MPIECCAVASVAPSMAAPTCRPTPACATHSRPQRCALSYEPVAFNTSRRPCVWLGGECLPGQLDDCPEHWAPGLSDYYGEETAFERVCGPGADKYHCPGYTLALLQYAARHAQVWKTPPPSSTTSAQAARTRQAGVPLAASGVPRAVHAPAFTLFSQTQLHMNKILNPTTPGPYTAGTPPLRRQRPSRRNRLPACADPS